MFLCRGTSQGCGCLSSSCFNYKVLRETLHSLLMGEMEKTGARPKKNATIGMYWKRTLNAK